MAEPFFDLGADTGGNGANEALRAGAVPGFDGNSRPQPGADRLEALVVEPEAGPGQGVGELLSHGGARLCRVGCLGEALAALREAPAPDAVVVDAQVLAREGPGALAALQDEAVGVAVIVVVEAREAWWGLEAVRAGAQDCLVREELTAGGLMRALCYAMERKRVERALRQREEQLRHDALHDALTGLANRALFLDRLQIALRQYGRDPEKRFGLLYFDVDRFKGVNDTLGHGAGDDVLVEVARRLESSIRPGDTLARLGGDEFALLLGEVGTVEGAAQVAGRIRERLREPFTVADRTLTVSASIGVVLASEGYSSPQAMLNEADRAMYRAKVGGEAGCGVFAGVSQGQAMPSLEGELRGALARGELVMHYQPIVSLGSEAVVGLEGLLRWRHPELGLLGPDRFLALCSDRGLELELAWWVLGEVCREGRRWQEGFPGGAPPAVSVNVPGALLVEPGMAPGVKALLEKTGLAPGRLRLEVNERAVMEHGDLALAPLAELRGCGVELHVDDFGTGYSSLSHLQRFAYDSLKIDRSLVAGLGRSEGAHSAVRTLVALGAALGINVIAEGVERAEQAEALCAMGCPQAQGYWFSRPLEPAALESCLHAPLGRTLSGAG